MPSESREFPIPEKDLGIEEDKNTEEEKKKKRLNKLLKNGKITEEKN